MEAAQPADRVPADQTPPDGQPPVAPAAGREPTESGVVAASDRAGRRPRDMVISMLVLLVPIALLFAFYRGFLGGDQPTVVDPAPAVEQARSAGAFPVGEPTGLTEQWRPVRASYQTVEGGANLRIGYATPEGRGAQVVQSNVPVQQLLPTELTAQGEPRGAVDLAGRSWQRYTARGNEQAYVLMEPGRTVLVVGDAGENELRHLAASIR